MRKCNQCGVCSFVQEEKTVQATATNYKMDINSSEDCSSKNVILSNYRPRTRIWLCFCKNGQSLRNWVAKPPQLMAEPPQLDPPPNVPDAIYIWLRPKEFAFDGRHPLMEEDLSWKTTFAGRWPLKVPTEPDSYQLTPTGLTAPDRDRLHLKETDWNQLHSNGTDYTWHQLTAPNSTRLSPTIPDYTLTTPD